MIILKVFYTESFESLRMEKLAKGLDDLFAVFCHLAVDPFESRNGPVEPFWIDRPLADEECWRIEEPAEKV